MTKICSKCKQELSIECFSKHKKSKDGYRSYCKECAKVYQQKWYTENRSEENERRRKKYDPKTEHERYLLREANVKTTKKEWRKANPEKVAAQSARRRAAGRATKNDLNSHQWADIKARFNYSCAYCGAKLPLEIDHVIPVSKGGGTTVNNVVPACRSCNASKGNREVYKWFRSQPFYTISKEENITEVIKGETIL